MPRVRLVVFTVTSSRYSSAVLALDQFSLAAQRKPLPSNPNRYTFGVWLKAPLAPGFTSAESLSQTSSRGPVH